MKQQIIIFLVIAVIISLISSGIKISFNPFKFTVIDWVKGLGVFFTMIGLSLLSVSIYTKGWKDGENSAIEYIKKSKSIVEDDNKL